MTAHDDATLVITTQKAFLEMTGRRVGVSIHQQKVIPVKRPQVKNGARVAVRSLLSLSSVSNQASSRHSSSGGRVKVESGAAVFRKMPWLLAGDMLQLCGLGLIHSGDGILRHGDLA